MDPLDFLSGFDSWHIISEGMAKDEKYHCLKDGIAYLLRVADGASYGQKQAEYAYLQLLNRADLPVPECISFTENNNGTKVLTLLSWIPGMEAEKLIPKLSHQEQYDLGLQAGQILRRIHQAVPVTDSCKDWYERYFEVIDPRLDAYRKKGILFDGSEEVLNFVDENRGLLQSRPLCHHHGDYHTGNLIIQDGKLWVIDWHSVDFEGVGDPWYEFNRVDTRYPSFAKGQIDGYFDNSIPHEFWKLFALYFAVSAITSIVWAKYRAPSALDWVMERNRDVLRIFDRMQDPVPIWYRK